MSGSLTALSVDFGMHGEASRLVAVGWSSPELEFTWTLGEEALVLLERPAEEADYVLQVTARPFLVPGRLAMQRVHVLVNGRHVGKQVRRGSGTFEMRVAWELIRAHPHVAVTFLLPDAMRPCDAGLSADARRLGLAVSRIALLRVRGERRGTVMQPSMEVQQHIAAAFPAAAMRSPALSLLKEMPAAAHVTFGPGPDAPGEPPLSERLLEFESIGADAEFGLVQRRAEAEPLGLLRFAEASLDQVVAGLESGFAGIGAPGSVELRLRGREFMVADTRYGLHWHTGASQGQANPQLVLEREAQRLPFLRDKLLHDLQDGNKLLVFKRDASLSHGEIIRLMAAIGQHGPSELLLVQLADPVHPDGTAERVRAGLIRGYVARFAPSGNADDIAIASWVAMARAAHRIWRGDQAPR